MDTENIFRIIEALMLLPFLYQINQYILKRIKAKYSFFSLKKMNLVFFYHIFFGGLYYAYAFFNPSDSKRYFSRTLSETKPWFANFDLETGFIDFISYPFIHYFGFSYEMMMLLFTWIGFWGFVFGFLFFKENIPAKVRVFKNIDFLTLILFFPNMHFWSASLGKGAPIFLGLMLFAFSISKPLERKTGVLLSSALIFAIRPHMFLLVCLGLLYGLYFGKTKIKRKYKLMGAGLIISGIAILHQQILEVVGLNGSQNLISDFLVFATKRSGSLSEATSGVNMAGYSLPERFFAFWFRPLFFDAPGIWGIMVSFENLVYLLLFTKILKLDFIKFWKNAPANVKTCLMVFLATSFGMTFIMSNLGIMIRQKTMIMYFLFFVIYYFLAYEKTIANQLRLRKIAFSANDKNLKEAA